MFVIVRSKLHRRWSSLVPFADVSSDALPLVPVISVSIFLTRSSLLRPLRSSSVIVALGLVAVAGALMLTPLSKLVELRNLSGFCCAGLDYGRCWPMPIRCLSSWFYCLRFSSSFWVNFWGVMPFCSLKMLRRKRLFEGPAERPRLEILPCGFYSRVIKLPTFLNLIPALLFGSAVVVSLGC